MVLNSGDVGGYFIFDIGFLLGFSKACKNQENVR